MENIYNNQMEFMTKKNMSEMKNSLDRNSIR